MTIYQLNSDIQLHDKGLVAPWIHNYHEDKISLRIKCKEEKIKWRGC